MEITGEIVGRRFMVGDRVRTEEDDRIARIVFFPQDSKQVILRLESDKEAFRCVPFDRLRHADIKPHILSGWAVAFKDGHVEYWHIDPVLLSHVQTLALEIVGYQEFSVDVPVKKC